MASRAAGLPSSPGTLAAALVVLALTVEGCENGERETPDKSGAIDGIWTPQEGGSLSWGPKFDPSTVQVKFNGRAWSANNGCNGVTGTYEISGSQFEASADPVGAGECLGDSVPYEKLLPSAVEADASADELVLIDSEGELLLRLRRAE